nr:hypothetical protein [uncultured Ruminococcus sp.]
MQAYDVQSRQALFARCCLYFSVMQFTQLVPGRANGISSKISTGTDLFQVNGEGYQLVIVDILFIGFQDIFLDALGTFEMCVACFLDHGEENSVIAQCLGQRLVLEQSLGEMLQVRLKAFEVHRISVEFFISRRLSMVFVHNIRFSTFLTIR